jgi:hypothetical protein
MKDVSAVTKKVMFLAPLVWVAWAFGAMPACSNKMDPKDCAKLKEAAFEVVNQANVCSSNADCKPSTWPGCPKPLNPANTDKVKASMDAFQKGQCEEGKMNCPPPPASYCQEGICAFRYKPEEPAMKIEGN